LARVSGRGLAGRSSTWAVVVVVQEGIACRKRSTEQDGTGRGNRQRPAEGHELELDE
jgi:hypothetical protein